MPVAISTPYGTLTAATITWETDDWLLTTQFADGTTDTDNPFDAEPELTDEMLRSEAFLFLLPPDGLTDADMQALRDCIVIERPEPEFEMCEDSGASETCVSTTLEDAIEEAEEWAAGGSYDERVMVSVWLRDQFGNRVWSGQVAAGPEPKPEPTECGDDDEDHDWQAPIELVGGLRENPGVFSAGGTRFDYRMVCAKCGTYKHSWDQGMQRNPGDLAEGVEYEPANDASLAWVAANAE